MKRSFQCNNDSRKSSTSFANFDTTDVDENDQDGKFLSSDSCYYQEPKEMSTFHDSKSY